MTTLQQLKALPSTIAIPKITILLIPIASAASFLILPRENDTRLQHLEIAFWISAFCATFFAFFTLELIFRSKDTKICAPLPILPEAIFLNKYLSILKISAFTLLLSSALFISNLFIDPILFIALTLMIPASILITTASAFAVILYAATAKNSQMTSFGPTAFATAPAIALAVSLFTILILKLFIQASLTHPWNTENTAALSIVLIVFFPSLIYAYLNFKKNYYNILADFLQNDTITFNKDFDYINDKIAKKINNAKSPLHTLIILENTIYERKFTLQKILFYTTAILLTILSLYQNIPLPPLHLAIITNILLLTLASPWVHITSENNDNNLINSMPITNKQKQLSKTIASILQSLKLILPFLLLFSITIYSQTNNPLQSIIYLTLSTALTLLIAISLTPFAIKKHSLARSTALSISITLALIASIIPINIIQ